MPTIVNLKHYWDIKVGKTKLLPLISSHTNRTADTDDHTPGRDRQDAKLRARYRLSSQTA